VKLSGCGVAVSSHRLTDPPGAPGAREELQSIRNDPFFHTAEDNLTLKAISYILIQGAELRMQ
jgi:hypothetical protein